MKILKVVPKQIVVTVEFTADDLFLLRLALENTTLTLDLTKPKNQQAEHFILNELYPLVTDITKELEDMK